MANNVMNLDFMQYVKELYYKYNIVMPDERNNKIDRHQLRDETKRITLEAYTLR